MRVLVCGGRDFNDYALLCEKLDALNPGGRISLIIHGGATGADSLADEWAKATDTPCLRHPAKWRPIGKGAGPLRNQEMLDKWKPQEVVAFPGGRGTADMVRRAKAANIPVIEVAE